ncbi:hypothetical protein [Aliikangiella coralliicola]|uniref:Secreted protein n=1 Tax=Aliikangiella coralliicola TaxID=2592383 RepID=A0A545UH08_9GAMM|nr:hypothetical protein [Aliikangiella coralliicola]TQV88758.1 hypothetical protein FLL46_04295 [Aliikangiella coralliicola]
MKKILLILVILFVSNSYAKNNQAKFFEVVKSLCGQTFNGKTVYPEDPDHSFAGKKLVMHIKDCSEKEIRIPFKVGEDTSRTWILTKTEKGLLFKHDHRHDDGTPHELTMYGGHSDDRGTELSQSFPADKETHKLVPAGKTNVWTISFDENKKHFIYYLERHAKPRYKAIFDLTRLD